MSFIDVQDIGQELLDQGFLNAAGDGTTDDHDALQRLIDREEIPFDERAGYNAITNPTPPAPPQPGGLYFSPGRYRINSTLVFPNRTGYHLLGCGMAQRVPDSSAAKGCESVIVWGGTSQSAMIQYSGQGLVWNGLGLWGCNWPGSSSSCPGVHAGVGILITRDADTQPLETGKVWFGSLLIEGCNLGISVQGTAADTVDEIAFGYFWVKDQGQRALWARWGSAVI